MDDESLAELILSRLYEFSPALSIRPLEGTEEERKEHVVVEITMCRTADKQREFERWGEMG